MTLGWTRTPRIRSTAIYIKGVCGHKQKPGSKSFTNNVSLLHESLPTISLSGACYGYNSETCQKYDQEQNEEWCILSELWESESAVEDDLMEYYVKSKTRFQFPPPP